MLTQITTEMTGDALFDMGHKQWGHALQTTSFLTAFSYGFIIDTKKQWWYCDLAAYTLLRFAVGDLIYNAVRGLPVTYIGSTSTYDRFMSTIDQGDGFLLPRAGALTISVCILIRNTR